MKKLLIAIAAVMISANAMAFDIDGLVGKASQIVSNNKVDRSNSKRAWCRSLKTTTICQKTFYDMYCINSDYDHPEMTLVKETSAEGQLGSCVFEKTELVQTGKYDETYKVQSFCEIQRNQAENTYSCKWGDVKRALIKREKSNNSLGNEVMI